MNPPFNSNLPSLPARKSGAVLVADDSEVVRRLAGHMLNRLGYLAVLACDGDEAWDYFQKKRFSAVLSDWHMPNCDGLELCRRVRASEGSRLPFLLMSSDPVGASTEARRRGIEIDASMGKPFEYSLLKVYLRPDSIESRKRDCTQDSAPVQIQPAPPEDTFEVHSFWKRMDETVLRQR
ncbi:MAG: response regulator [Opitutae bacterium]|nr:response regulator [Opitutae bacterium]